MESSLGDMAALAHLFERYRDQLLRMVRRRIDPTLASRIDAEDVVSCAFLTARKKYPSFKNNPKMAPYPWLYRIVLDALIESWRRETRECRDAQRTMHWPDESVATFESIFAGDGTSASGAFERRVAVTQVRETLESLSPTDQEILWMRHFDQPTHREAAGILDITESAATLRYVRALRRMQRAWKKVHGDLPDQ